MGFIRPPLVLFLSLAFLIAGSAGQLCPCITIDNEWDGNYNAIFEASTIDPFYGFEIILTFDQPVDSMDFWEGDLEKIDDTTFRLYDEDYKGGTGEIINFNFQVHFSGSVRPEVVAVTFNGVDVCDGGDRWTTLFPYTNPCDATGMTPYDYSQVLCMSYLFYEAERSGPLPADQRVTWRWDSALTDGQDVGEDLTGGYYDAGDHVKFGFPMAFTATMLAWGLIDFKEGHETAGQLEYGQAGLRWATDYFLKAHTAHWEFYGQVGSGGVDHGYWGRPEDMYMERPSYKIDENAPGTELACETAAALAGAAIVFQDVDSTYAAEVLEVAKELYDFGDQKRENYHNSIPDASAFYKSWSGYGDELCWAALWLYRATRDQTYLDKAQAAWIEFDLGSDAVQFAWDDKRVGAYSLGAMLEPSNPQWGTALQGYLTWLRDSATYTPDGLVFLDMWGANRHAANVAFIALWAAKYGDAALADTNRQWAEGQMGQLLGDAGRSYVVGYGFNPPERPHHRSSSCPPPPASCTDGWAQNQDGPNPHILFGALVGGPSEDGTYVDDRDDYVHNEVACDYNAAFTGAVAAMIENL